MHLGLQRNLPWDTKADLPIPPHPGHKRGLPIGRVADARETFATRLILSGLTDAEVAEIMAWSVEKVSGIRRTYVDQSRAIVAIGERIMKSSVN